MVFGSPLRYPGGKGRLTSYMTRVISANGLEGGTYVEPFAGGAGMAVNLLLSGMVSHIVLNDADRSIYAFWMAVKEKPDELIEMIRNVDVTLAEWEEQRSIQARKETAGLMELGFSTFFMNRTNRSGIITGGIIGGRAQDGKYRMDARFNRDDLIERIERIATHSEDMTVECMDGGEFIENLEGRFDDSDVLVYIDPPYYNKASTLYMNHYSPEDHIALASTIRGMKSRWILSYDDVPEIRSIYGWAEPLEFSLGYSTYEIRTGRELFYTSSELIRPDGDVSPTRMRITTT